MKSAKKFEMEFTFMVSITAGPSKKTKASESKRFSYSVPWPNNRDCA